MRERVESALGAWGRFVTRHALGVALVCLGLAGAFATQLQYFRLDTSSESYYHEQDPVRLEYDAFRDLFGRDAVLLLAIRPEGGVFTLPFLETLRSIHEAIEEEVPYLVEVTSLLNVRETVGSDEGLEVGDFLEDWPEDAAALAEIERRARANPLYRNYLISADGATTALVIETEAFTSLGEEDELSGFGDADPNDPIAEDPIPITGAEDLEIVEGIEAILARHASPGLEFHLAGTPTFSAIISRHMVADMGMFSGLSIALVAFFLAVLFRRVSGVLLPLVTVVVSVLTTLAFMGATDTPMMPPTQIIPSFLLAVGMGGAVHLLAIFYQARRRGVAKDDAVVHALEHSGLPIVMTSLTTAGGLLSFIPAALRPISQFGWVTPVGILLSLFFVLTLLPALMMLFPMRTAPAQREDAASQRTLVRIGAFSTRRPGVVCGAWLAILAFSVAGFPRLELGHDMVRWFPEGDPTREAVNFLNAHFGGAASYELLISTDEENGLHDPALLRALDQVREETEAFERAGIRGDKNVSLLDVVKETHRALNENREDHYTIPDERELVAQELLLFENSGSDDVEDLVTPQFDRARLTVRVPFGDGARYIPYLAELTPRLEALLGDAATLKVTGGARLFGNTVTAALETMVRSYTTALVVITVLMILLLGSLRMGLLAMIPNLAPVLFALGLMGWLSIQLDMFSLMIGTIVIGLAVDDTIHFMHNFRRAFDRTDDVDVAVAETLRGTGQALLFTSCVLVFSFLVYTQAYLLNLWTLGAMTASAIVMAFLADLTLAPAIVSLALRGRPRDTDEALRS